MPTDQDLLLDMQKHGLKITPQRRLIAGCLAAGGGCSSAKELFDRVRGEQPNVSMDTVYRTLGALCESGMLCRVDKPGRGSVYELIAGRHLHYMVCSACGRREVFEGCVFDQTSLTPKQKKGFALTGHKLELYGLCSACNRKGRKK